MPSARELIKLAEHTRKDPGACCLISTYILGVILLKVSLAFYILDNHNVVTPCLTLSVCALWLFLICCGWAIIGKSSPIPDNPKVAFPCCGFILAIVLGLVVLSAFDIHSNIKRGNRVNFNVSEAALTHFNISGDNTASTLNYNLEVKLTVGPNRKKAGVYYESVQAWASYQGLNFTSLSLPPFYLAGKSIHSSNSSTVVLQPLVFQGQQELVLPPDALKRYQQDEAAGRFSIDVTVFYLGFRGFAVPGHGHKLTGVKTFALTELPLPNAPTGWVERVDMLSASVVADIVIISVSAFSILCILGCCSYHFRKEENDNIFSLRKIKEKRETDCLMLCMILFLLPFLIILIGIFIASLVRSLKKVDQVKLKVSNATLTQFNLSSFTVDSSTLSYNLSLAITVGPNYLKTGVYFDKLEATAYYQGQNFTSLALSPFYLQGRQEGGSRTVILRPVFQGQQVMTTLIGGNVLARYQEETAARQYSIVVTLSYSGIRIDNYDYSNPTSVNETLSEAGGHKQLNGVAAFELKVPLLSGADGGAVSSGAAAVANVLWLLVMIPVCLMFHFAFEV